MKKEYIYIAVGIIVLIFIIKMFTKDKEHKETPPAPVLPLPFDSNLTEEQARMEAEKIFSTISKLFAGEEQMLKDLSLFNAADLTLIYNQFNKYYTGIFVLNYFKKFNSLADTFNTVLGKDDLAFAQSIFAKAGITI
jgi:hypothetical protein